MTKVLLVANTGWYLYNFRLPLARLLRSQGIETVLVSPHDAYVPRLQEEGFRWINLDLDRKSVNPFLEIAVVARLLRIYTAERPARVHHFTVKCMLYGTAAAKIAEVPLIVNAVTGLGHLFLGRSRKARLLRPVLHWIYRKTLTAPQVRVIFQNPDDLQTFTDFRLVDPTRCIIIRGSGVNLERFAPQPETALLCDNDASPPVVLFASRLTREKGLVEFVGAARRVKATWPNAVFRIVGDPDPGNPSSLNSTTLAEWRREGIVEIRGHQDMIEDAIADATLVVLPSYREGTPRILLEAAAMGKPIVTTDVPGCRETVVHGENGLLVPVRDPEALAGAICQLLENPELRQQMGRNGRRKMVEEFDDQVVARNTVAVYGLQEQSANHLTLVGDALPKAA